MAKFNCNSTCGFVNPELFTRVVAMWLRHNLVTVDWLDMQIADERYFLIYYFNGKKLTRIYL